MPRQARYWESQTVVHIISRFVNREFRLTDSVERGEYLDRVGRGTKRSDWRLLAYALMSSHVHWVALAGTTHPSKLLHPAHTGFAMWLNRRQGRLGPVFASRFRTVAIAGASAAALIAYVHNNPVRAGLVTHAEDSEWSSHRTLVGPKPPPPWLDVDLALAVCGLPNNKWGRASLAAMIRARETEKRRALWDASPKVEACVRQQLGTAHVTPCMVDADADRDSTKLVLSLSDDTVVRRQWLGRPARVLEAVARSSGISREELTSASRQRGIVRGRRLSLIVWTRYLGRPQCEMAAALGVSPQAASRLLTRNDPGLRISAERVAARFQPAGVAGRKLRS